MLLPVLAYKICASTFYWVLEWLRLWHQHQELQQVGYSMGIQSIARQFVLQAVYSKMID